MAGHSQFKNIMHRKGRQDAVKSKLFSKLAREITVSAKLGMPDPAMNPRLRAAVIAARAENMSKDEPLGRFLRKIATSKFEPANGPATLAGLAVETDDRTGLAVRVAAVRLGGPLEEARPRFWE